MLRDRTAGLGPLKCGLGTIVQPGSVCLRFKYVLNYIKRNSLKIKLRCLEWGILTHCHPDPKQENITQ